MFTLIVQNVIYENLWGLSSPELAIRIGLSLTEPNVEGGNITMPGGNYASWVGTTRDFSIRQTFSGPTLTDVYLANDDYVQFVESGPTIPWGTIPYWFLEVMLSPGVYTVFDFGVITNRITGVPEPVTIGTEDSFAFDPDKLIFRFDNPEEA